MSSFADWMDRSYGGGKGDHVSAAKILYVHFQITPSHSVFLVEKRDKILLRSCTRNHGIGLYLYALNYIVFCSNILPVSCPSNSTLISFDVKSLYTNVPISPTLDHNNDIFLDWTIHPSTIDKLLICW